MKLTSKQTQRLKKQLLQEKRDLEHQLATNEHYGLKDSLAETTGELSAYDNHPADLGSELFERGKDIALNENAEHHLEQVNVALEQIEAGEYGTCVACGRPIPYARLEAIPTTLYCIEHVPDPDRSLRRPVEEKVLNPPFGNHSEEADEHVGFDGEDAWQIVAGWGTSNTPAMAEDPDVFDYDSNPDDIDGDENVGFVESLESFLATDIYGQHISVMRNKAYRKYIEDDEGDDHLQLE